ncbi:hypothetical protein SmJEL517_g05865 [Synchytrium microbalum]|uniref:AB hydrolase-1 domain-containing protein n=1 Tax=Synchytrium microbalum TaxID=1806994 RepID=A0A507BXU5_9FUNG|nr:uncharacterized protein SmJEL517_g05865 [Synchytrium microbalum]TPX30614.1 hypothetical protein SmJEL517_g05865 [Synchytrium microbalum]
MYSLPNAALKAVRTPEERFTNLPDYNYKPHYIQYGHLRMSYIDEQSPIFDLNSGELVYGASESEVSTEIYLCLHGQPTWGYLYRKMVPVFLASRGRRKTGGVKKLVRRRVIVPDLIGFGRSDKPLEASEYTFELHRDSILCLITRLDLKNITLVCQDWGGIIGLTIPMDMPTRFNRILAMNTCLPLAARIRPGFPIWRQWCNDRPDMIVSEILSDPHSPLGLGNANLSQAEKDAYDAPFPDITYKAGARAFPNLVPEKGVKNGPPEGLRAREWLGSPEAAYLKVFLAIGHQDPCIGSMVMRATASLFSSGCAILDLPEAGHFVQEWGQTVAAKALDYFEAVSNIDVLPPKSKSSKL